MTSEITYRPPTRDDLLEVSLNMREDDVAEVQAMGFRDADQALRHSHRISEWSAAAICEEKPIAIMGTVKSGPLLSPMGIPWLLGTPDLLQIGRSILTEGRRVVYAMSQDYAFLANYVWAGNPKSVRWLSRLGFTIHPFVEMPPYGEPFHRFELRR